MKVLWSDTAEQDRSDVFEHIARQNPRAAVKVDQLFSEAAARLADWPKSGRPGRIPGTREFLAQEHYFLVYEVDEAAWTLTILAVLHTSRQWPPLPVDE